MAGMGKGEGGDTVKLQTRTKLIPVLPEIAGNKLVRNFEFIRLFLLTASDNN